MDSNEYQQMLKDFDGKPMEDTDQFEPVAGGYLGVITKADKNDEYGFHSLSIKITEVKDGDKAVGRYLSKTYNTKEDREFTVGEQTFKTEAIAEKKKLLTDLVTMGIEIPKELNNDEAFDMLVGTAKDRSCAVRAWKTKSNKQACKIVKEIKVRKQKKATAVAEAPSEF